ncbi:MAG: lysylphosphatidylglycerol synthase transmembrane domain-containing protein [Pyrinomonadaceae bacterium]
MRKYFKYLALLLLAGLILWWFGRGLNWSEVGHTVAQADKRWLALAAAVIAGGYFVRALRWRTLLAPLCETSLRELFAATTIGFSALILIGRAGEVVRPVVLPMRDRRVRASASFVTIGLERICDSVAVVVIFALNLIWFRPPAGRPANEFAHVQEAGLFLLVLAAVGIAGLAIFKRNSEKAIAGLERRITGRRFIPGVLSRTIIVILRQLADALSVLVNWRELVAVIGWTSLLWFAVGFASWCVLHAFGLGFGFSSALFIMGWSLVASLVPTPGGAAGAFHAATAAGLIYLNVEKDHAAAVAIIMHLTYFAPALVFGLYFFLRGDINFAHLRHVLSAPDVEHAVQEETQDPNLELTTLEVDPLNSKA